MEGNKLGDSNVRIILDVFIDTNVSVKNLNLSKNYISNLNCDMLSEVIAKNEYIMELYLHWNHI